ncbi:MAG: hypothetical protein ACLGHN_04445 [Bacteriovoracia bacterium]
MKRVFTLIVMIFSLPSWATVTVGTSDCPTHFEGRVKEVIEPVGATNFFSANKVVFENQRTLKGEVDDQVLLDILQNGPFKVEKNKDYLVQLREGKLCWMEEI